ncbi:Geranylgeranyl transferase type-2 subunit alpha, partial [Gracilaria domingensis]
LLCTPDNLTAWNARKACTKPETVLAELEFNRLMITRGPKSAESWSHRSWLIRTFLFPLKPEQVVTELQLAWFASSRKPHNYYAGVHRLRLLQWMTPAVKRNEQEKSRKWLRTHVSDSSGWWYHRTLLTTSPKDE